MKTQIRKGVFETNSSSVHAISISNTHDRYVINTDRTLTAEVGEFGWEVSSYDNPEDKLKYLWTAIYDNIYTYTFENGNYIKTPLFNIKDWEYIITNALEPFGITVEFKYPKRGEWYGIDHGNELKGWLEDLKSNPEMIADFILNSNSCVSTGNDNGEDTYPGYNEDDSYYFYGKGN